MSYLVLARKYRPKNFESIVGQDHVVRALTHALESGRLHHAYLFTGTRGIGKTTLSRILAKSLNCEKGITSAPCGECEACKAIDSDRFVDYIEMDAASNRGIADMLQLLEQAVYAPTAARFKVYMIDEVHMLTSQAFNAMLKTLEEPPEYVKFILATTDPQKIPVTVLSRCLQFNLKQMPVVHIVDHLARVLDREGVPYEKTALQLLAQGAQGSMRDALSLTDQAIAYTAGKVTGEAVQDMLGSLDSTYLVRLLDCLAATDGKELLKVADEMAFRSLSYSAALQDLGLLLHRIAVVQSVPGYLSEEVPAYQDISRLAGIFSAEELQLYYQIAIHGRNELGLAPDEYAGFTMTLLRMLAFAPVQRKRDSLNKLQAASLGENGKTALRFNHEPQAFAGKMPPKMDAPAVKSANNASDIPPWIDEVAEDTVAAVSSPAAKDAVAKFPAFEEQAIKTAENRTVVSSSVKEKPSLAGWDCNWPKLAAELPLRGLTQQLAQQTELIRWEKTESSCVFHLKSPVATLCTPNNVSKLGGVLSDYFGCAVKITTEIGKVEETANQNAIEARAERQRQAEEALTADPYLRNLAQEFGGHIVEGSIKPL
ncbi:DNA polymerase III subunit gamma/tau [Oxalobacter paraformigenes]|uniref:DNA polymerase III subunit gamma/tau n=1 Tax=Oxalobacter paraformigenes TaxID=556268 RepID=C3X5A4_9BURK|nr:DNA polymerase III subunit gamma/tau [Oxalobacter paraformigenes]EEO28390.1 DNA polymerase III, subunit gamma and tau [Oxalobacter paraformigenes]